MFDAAPGPAALKIAIAACALLAAFAFVAVHVWTRRKARRAKTWPIAPGVVTSARLSRRWGVGNGVWIAGLWYVPLIGYRYEAGGKVHTGTRVFLSETGFPKRRDAQAVVDRYAVGSAVEVRHDPARPALACLEPEHREARALGTAVLLGLLALAALALG